MCEYCGRKEKHIEELYEEKDYGEIFQKWFRVNIKSSPRTIQRVFKINYCPMCGRRLGDNNER